ncbi:hypothetical protein [Kribbella kalugense]|uniref:Uncharacterized protein n=1 Tax=Kribbella kalugense TaxID=2512221 RepID=A0A4V3G8G4_9ACTN|nr:hypothetical protein [Kribbella kalugense]TDW22804.1 hypothetical protein EV650_1650 [Kribbella kalugense]
MSTYDPPYAIARTSTEVSLYLDLIPCPDCGSDQADWQEEAFTYTGECVGCGAQREYTFSPPEHAIRDTFGGPEPSELIDAGQWLAVADRIAGEVAVNDRSEGALTAMALARQAVEEVLKFIPPSQDTVPDEAFWTDAGRAERELDPGRFRLDRLLVVRDSYT